MKRLEELGISPAPWELIPYSESIDTKKPTLGEVESNGENIFYDGLARYPDARLIAAAPELYEALRMYQDAFEEIRKSAWFLDANFNEIMQLNKVMKAAEAALAKAARESEVNE